MKIIHLVALLIFGSNIITAQETKARVTVTATANDNLEAKNLALRSAIEQAFGAYISSNTEILNDELIKDEISSISSGNIDSIHVISETKLIDGRTSVSLLAVVSVNKLATFCESKGYKVEFKGGLFTANIKQQKLNESAELLAVENICDVGKSIINRSFDYNLTVSQPQQDNSSGTEMWNLVYDVKVKPNVNFNGFKSYVLENISKISMKSDEVLNYGTLNKTVYNVKWNDPSQNIDTNFYFRNLHSLALIQDLFWHAKFSLGFFKIASNIDTIDIFNDSIFPKYDSYSFVLNNGRIDMNLDYGEVRDGLPVWPGTVYFTSSLLRKDRYARIDEFSILEGEGAPNPRIPEVSNYNGGYVNIGLGDIYKKRTEFYLKTTDTEHKEKFYKEKYIFVLQSNIRGDYEDFWNGGLYTSDDDYLRILFGLDSDYEAEYVFSRSFRMSDLEKITNVEVYPAETTLGL